MDKKIKILMLGDCVLAPSGVGTQMKYVSEGLVNTGRYQLVQLGGAVKHENMNPIQFKEFGDQWIIYPVEGYGNIDIVRSVIRTHRPDILFFVTDPRFYYWLWQIENEIRPLLPMIYWHVWDNFPYPKFNKTLYKSTDVVATISKLTHSIVKNVSPETEEIYLPHSVNTDIFKRLPDNVINDFKNQNLPLERNKTVFFWNNRNARRKQSGTIIWWFKEFLDQVGYDKACLIMHTEPKDENGQDLEAIIRDLGLDNSNLAVKISQSKMPPENLAVLYNSIDCTINISDAEGFGLCLDSNTRILTENGNKTIKDIIIGDKALSLDGKFHNVLNKLQRKDKVLNIKTVGNEILKITEDHAILSYKSKYAYKNFSDRCKEKDQLEKHENIDLNWNKIKDLRIGDYVVVPKLKKTESLPETIDLLDWISLKDHYMFDDEYIWSKYTDIKLKRKVKIDEDFLNFVGWYIAEGNCSNENSVILDLNLKEKDIAEEKGNYLKKTFGINYSISLGIDNESPIRKNRCRMRVSNKLLGEFFGKLCGSTCRNKFINKLFMKDPEKLGPLLNGIFSGDGNGNKYGESYRLTNTSVHLVYQVKFILSYFGIYSSIAEEDNSAGFGNETILKLNTAEKYFNKFCNITKLTKEKSNRINLKKTNKRERRWIDKEEFFLVPIRKIEASSLDEVDVFDIQVEGAKNFVANGIVVHNSTMESIACETPIIVTMTGGLQEQITDYSSIDITEEFMLERNIKNKGVTIYDHGIGIEPSSKAIIGSQQVPYIYEDRPNKDDFINALKIIHNMPKTQRHEMGKKGREHIIKNYNFQTFVNKWDELFMKIYNENGSWETRKNFKNWELRTI